MKNVIAVFRYAAFVGPILHEEREIVDRQDSNMYLVFSVSRSC
jgi:hypothetical protein